MSNVVSLADVRAASLALDSVQEAYEKLSRTTGFNSRAGQKDLSRLIRDSLVEGRILAAEAPTGTGKTIAYLIGAAEAVKQLELVNGGQQLPVVIATATVGLQTQVIGNDVPRVVDAGIIERDSAVIAKGRGRYFCVLAAERMLQGEDEDLQYDIFSSEENEKVDGLDEIREMTMQWHGQVWRGDLDSYGDQKPVYWGKVQASSDTCISRKCDYYDRCPYFVDRRRLAHAKVIIANHDLVLSDLSAQMQDQETVFPFNQYILVFDEAHHLPAKAMEIGASGSNLVAVLEKMPAVALASRRMFGTGDLARFLDGKGIQLADFNTGNIEILLSNAIKCIRAVAVDDDSRYRRFPADEMPIALQTTLDDLCTEVNSLRDTVTRALNSLKTSNLANKDARLKGIIAEALYEGSMANGLLGQVAQTLKLFIASTTGVRWVSHAETYASVHVSPTDGDKILHDLVWNNPRVKVALLSATLQDLEGFDRFKERAGLPDDAVTYAMPHVFPYGENMLCLMNMQYSPTQADREGYLKELCQKMPAVVNGEEGTLAIFTSRAVMLSVVPHFRAKFGHDKVLVQTEMGIKKLVDTHKARMDQGKGSILCGLATVAEGLDLPGHYCTHVLISGIPFSVPTNPVEAERAERLGNAYFYKYALPDAFVKLVQMVGRLMRRETDRGRITVFDNRLYTKRYGWKIVKSLPPFKLRRITAPA